MRRRSARAGSERFSRDARRLPYARTASDTCRIAHRPQNRERAEPIAQCGHVPHEEQPERVNAPLLDFLRGWAG